MSDTEKPTLLVIDGHSLAFRAFYALPLDSFTTRDGQHTNAIHGFLSMLILLLQNEKPTHLAVAFDISVRKPLVHVCAVVAGELPGRSGTVAVQKCAREEGTE